MSVLYYIIEFNIVILTLIIHLQTSIMKTDLKRRKSPAVICQEKNE